MDAMTGRNGVILGIILIVVVGLIYLVQNSPRSMTELGSENVGIANPASTNCVALGGRLEIVDGADGQFGLCHLPDGRVCEEWALFRDGSCETPE